MAFVASLLAMASQPAGTVVLQNTKLMTDAFVLEEVTGGVYSVIPADEYRVKPSGYIVKRSADDDGNGVDWSSYTTYYATGYYARPDAVVSFLRAPVTFAQVEIAPPTDADNALDLELAYSGVVRDLIAGAGDLRIDENGLLSGDVSVNRIIRLGHGAQTKKPRRAANVDNASSVFSWVDVNNAKQSDNNYAANLTDAGEVSDYLWLDDFGFRIPQGANVVGIAVSVELFHNVAGGETVTLQLSKVGALAGTTGTATVDITEYVQTVGGAADVWGAEWAPAEINASNFGVALWVSDNVGRATVYVDSVTVTVYYRTARSSTLLDAGDNYLSAGILFTNDSWFSASGAGLPYGSCWGNEIGWSQASAAQNTWYKVSDADVSDGQLNLVTHDGSGKLTVSKAGKYLANWGVTGQVSGNKHWAVGVGVDGTIANDGQTHIEAVANTENTVGGTAILSLTANQTVELMMRTIDTGTPTIEVHDMSLSVVQIGA